MDWCTIESDPGVFTELVAKAGVRDVQVEELFAMDESAFRQLQPVHGLIFLFKFDADLHRRDTRETLDPSTVPEVFFMKQVVTNACATQAILSVLLNAPSIDVGDALRNFRDVSSDPRERGELLRHMDVIRTAHNSFARPEHFDTDESTGQQGGDAFHFVAFVPVAGAVYELDGLREGPVLIGRVPDGSDWLSIAQPAVEERIAAYSGSEIRFNLMAVCGDQLALAKRRLALQQRRARALVAAGEALDLTRVAAADGSIAEGTSDLDDPTLDSAGSRGGAWSVGADGMARGAQAAQVVVEAEHLRDRIAVEEEKRERWTRENERRRHNWLAVIEALLRFKARNNTLIPALERAQQRAAERRAQAARKRARPEGAAEEEGE